MCRKGWRCTGLNYQFSFTGKHSVLFLPCMCNVITNKQGRQVRYAGRSQ